MNIDLFLNPHGEIGLLLDRLPGDAPAGAIYDAQTRDLTLEMAGGKADPLHLNITVEEAHSDLILLAQKIYIGALRDGMIALTLEAPLFYLNDPYGSAFGENRNGFAPRRSLMGFEQFIKRCTTAQPIHRIDLGNENMQGSVLHGMNPRALEFIPELLRQRLLEKNARISADVTITQTIQPGGMGGSNVTVRHENKKNRNEDDQRE